MKNKLLNTVAWIILAIIILFILTVATNFFIQIFIFQSDKYMQEGLTAFMGAFFAFLFLRIADAFGKYYERKRRHYNALVELEQYLNSNFLLIQHNLFVIRERDNALKQAKEKENFIFNPHSFVAIPTRDNLLLDFLDSVLINKTFIYNADIKAINSDLMANEKFYNLIQMLALNHRKDEYLINFEFLNKQCSAIKTFLEDLDEKTIKLLAVADVLAKRKVFFTKLVHFLSNVNYKKIEHEIIAEEAKIRKELVDSKRKSEVEIQDILNKDK